MSPQAKGRKKRTFVKLSRIEKAIVNLADMMEDPNHDQYMILKTTLEILGLELLPPKGGSKLK